MENRNFMTVDEVVKELKVSKSYSYKIVKQLNEELSKLGYLTFSGRVNANYFYKKVCYTEQQPNVKRTGVDNMAVYKDGDKWRVIYRYTNWKGEKKQTQKRGFTTKKEAQMW